MKVPVSIVAILLLMQSLFTACKKTEPDVLIPETHTDTIQAETVKPKPNTSVIAGESIGNIVLEMPVDQLAFLGEPDLSDAAMGKSWMTWYSDSSEAVSGKYELNIFTNYKDDTMKQKVVRLIRATSPEFLVDSIGPGAKMPEVRERFPDIRNVGDYAHGKTKDFISIYDDEPRGIAFEFLNDSCVGIIIHPKENDVTLDYRTFRPDMTLR